MDKLLPDRLKELWGRVERKQLTVADGEYQQGRLLDEYRAIWTEALILEGQQDLRHWRWNVVSGSGSTSSASARRARARAPARSPWSSVRGTGAGAVKS